MYKAGTEQIRYHAHRSREIFGIWESVVPRARLVRVLGSFDGNPVENELRSSRLVLVEVEHPQERARVMFPFVMPKTE